MSKRLIPRVSSSCQLRHTRAAPRKPSAKHLVSQLTHVLPCYSVCRGKHQEYTYTLPLTMETTHLDAINFSLLKKKKCQEQLLGVKMEMVWAWVCFLKLTQACSGPSHVTPGRASPPGPCCRPSLGLGPDKDSGVCLRHRKTLASVFATWDIAFWRCGAHLRLIAEIGVEAGWLSLLRQTLPLLKTRKHFLIGNLKCPRGYRNVGRASWLSRAEGICHPSCTPPQKLIDKPSSQGSS